MAMQSVLVTITLLMVCSLSGCSGNRGTEGQPPTTKPGGGAAKTAAQPAGKAKKLALLVGINKYKAVNGLSGCVADVRNMEGLLKGTFEFPDDSIRVLTDEQATHAGIVTGLQGAPRARAEKDAIVVFHYSGHGSQMKDPTGKSPSGQISTIVPYDSRTEGVYDITRRRAAGAVQPPVGEDQERDVHLRQLPLRPGAAGHRHGAPPASSTPTRANRRPRRPRRNSPRAASARPTRGSRAATTPCSRRVRPTRSPSSIPTKGNPCGTLTHFFVAEVRGSGKAGATYRDVMDKVKAKVTGDYRRQHPNSRGPRSTTTSSATSRAWPSLSSWPRPRAT